MRNYYNSKTYLILIKKIIKIKSNVRDIKIFLRFETVDKNENAHNERFGNRLAEGITMSCSSLSAIVPADEQISAFCTYLRL